LTVLILSFFISPIVIQADDYYPLPELYIDASLDAEGKIISGVMSFVYSGWTHPSGEVRFQLYPDWSTGELNLPVTIDSVFQNHIQNLDEFDKCNNGLNEIDITDSLFVYKTKAILKYTEFMFYSGFGVITVYFTTQLPEPGRCLGYRNNLYVLEAWYPVPTPYRNGKWVIEEYDANAELTSDHHDFKITFNYPDSLDMIVSGDVIVTDSTETQKTTQFILGDALDCPIVFHKDLEFRDTVINGIPISAYYPPGDEFMIDTLFSVTAQTFDWMANNIAEYPRDKLVYVLSAVEGGGKELPEMILLDSPAKQNYRRSYETLIIHEVIHEWFYGSVASSPAGEPWLDEAVTEYLSNKINRDLTAPEVDLFSVFGLTLGQITLHRLFSRSLWDIMPVDLASYHYNDGTVYFQAVYAKGSLLLRTLAGLMGEENELAFWKDYFNRYNGKYPTAEDFYALADEYLPEEAAYHTEDIIGYVGGCDLAITSISFEPVVDSAFETADSVDHEPRYKSLVSYKIVDPFPVPIELRLYFDDASVFDTTLNSIAGYYQLERIDKRRIVGAEIDPNHLFTIEHSPLDNSLKPDAASGTGLRLFSGATFLIELWYDLVWGL